MGRLPVGEESRPVFGPEEPAVSARAENALKSTPLRPITFAQPFALLFDAFNPTPLLESARRLRLRGSGFLKLPEPAITSGVIALGGVRAKSGRGSRATRALGRS